MRELALHLMDIAENSVAADASRIEISVWEDTSNDRLAMSVHDNGKGMDADMLAKVVDPFVTSRTTRKVGLGIPLLKAAAEACEGGMTIESQPGKGTALVVDFQRSHIDRMPLGNLASTFISLLISHPEVNWDFRYRVDDAEFAFEDAPIKEALQGVPFTEPEILTYLREMIESGVAETASSPHTTH